MCVHVSACGYECVLIVYMWGSEDNLGNCVPGTLHLLFETCLSLAWYFGHQLASSETLPVSPHLITRGIQFAPLYLIFM